MSEVFEGYERQYCEISASLSRKCASAANLDGEQKKQKVSEIKLQVEDAEGLIRKMDLEARSLQPSVKAALLAKLREYKSDLNNLKSEVKRITTANSNNATREELLEAGIADTLAVMWDALLLLGIYFVVLAVFITACLYTAYDFLDCCLSTPMLSSSLTPSSSSSS